MKKGIAYISIGLNLIFVMVIIYLLQNPIIQIKEIITTKTEYQTMINEVFLEKIIEIPIEVEKEVIVEVEKEPTYVYNITSTEREMLARIVYLEAGIESVECQKAITSVIINRWQNGYWGDTLEDVIYAEHQFTPAANINKTTPTEETYRAVDAVLKDGTTLPSYVMYFRADYHFNWKGYKSYTNIDSTYFGYDVNDK